MLSHEQRVRESMDDVREKRFPDLERATIRIRTFTSTRDYFWARPSLSALLLRGRRVYLLGVNTGAESLPDNALQAILVHELHHFQYYHERPRLLCLGVALFNLVVGDRWVTFERRTDLQTMFSGYATGLSAYRSWLYPRLTPSDLVVKRQRYFTPEEIDEIERIRAERPEMKEFWLKRPPRSLEEIQRSAPV